MFERSRHRDIALILHALDARALAQWHCWFAGGTAMALRYGEYRESLDIDFMVSDLAGYRELRQILGRGDGLAAIASQAARLELARPVRADQYGIRTAVRVGEARVIKFEIVLEARIALDPPGAGDEICGVRCLTPLDLAAEKLLANADRWADDAIYSRDIIDLAMQRAPRALLEAACRKAEGAYGDSVRQCIRRAVDSLRKRPHRLQECIAAMHMHRVTQAQLWQAIRRVERTLAAPPAS